MKKVRGTREARPLSLTKDPRLPKASEGLSRLERLPEAPGKFQGPRELQGGSGGKRKQEGLRGVEGEQGKQVP